MTGTSKLALLGLLFSVVVPATSTLEVNVRDPSVHVNVDVDTGFDNHKVKGCKSQPVCMDIEFTWQKGSPDGYTRDMGFVNGQLPGPLLELCQGDDVEFLIKNRTPYNQTVHFHGLEQLGTPWSDGVPGLSQFPIASGDEFLYKWTANDYGTYWYHSHFHSRVMDGLYGAILIHPASKEPSPFDAISNNKTDLDSMRYAEKHPNIAIVGDWNHFTSEEFMDIQKEANIDDVCMDSVCLSSSAHFEAKANRRKVLINGKGNTYCLSQEEIDDLTNPALQPLLNGDHLTAKG